jgi:hypothetical protein
MTRRFGDRAGFCVEVGEPTPPALRVVDLWAAGQRLTVDDNTAYVPSLTYYMRLEAERVRRGDIPPRPFPRSNPEENFRRLGRDETGFAQRFWFLRWSEILDDVSAYAYLEDEDLMILFAFWRTTEPGGQPFALRIPSREFTAVAEEAADFLDAGLQL